MKTAALNCLLGNTMCGAKVTVQDRAARPHLLSRTVGKRHKISQSLNPSICPLQLALARGHRWLAMLESGEVKSLRQIAEREKLDLRYIRRMVRLTSLSPHIVEAILDDALPSGSSLFDFSDEVPLLWAEQGGASSTP